MAGWRASSPLAAVVSALLLLPPPCCFFAGFTGLRRLPQAPLGDIFGPPSIFVIPDYTRAFSWPLGQVRLASSPLLDKAREQSAQRSRTSGSAAITRNKFHSSRQVLRRWYANAPGSDFAGRSEAGMPKWIRAVPWDANVRPPGKIFTSGNRSVGPAIQAFRPNVWT